MTPIMRFTRSILVDQYSLISTRRSIQKQTTRGVPTCFVPRAVEHGQTEPERSRRCIRLGETFGWSRPSRGSVRSSGCGGGAGRPEVAEVVSGGITERAYEQGARLITAPPGVPPIPHPARELTRLTLS